MDGVLLGSGFRWFGRAVVGCPIRYYGVLLVLWAALGCSEKSPTVARVGSVDISRHRLDSFIERLSPGLRSKREGQQALLEHLQAVVSQELLIQAARARGIDTSTAVTHKFGQLRRRRLVDRYRAVFVYPRVEVTSAEIERAFVELGYDRERLVRRILVRTEADRDEVLAQLDAGKPFGELVQKYAANDLFARAGDGIVGWMGKSQLRRVAIPADVFGSLPVGQLAQPLRLPGGWQIYRFDGDRPAEVAEYWDEISDVLAKDKREAELQKEFEALCRDRNLRLHADGVEKLLRCLDGNPLSELQLSDADRFSVLYSYVDGTLTLGDYTSDLHSVGYTGFLEDSLGIVQAAERVSLPSRLMAGAAQEQGWHEEPEFTEWVERKRHGLVLQHLVEVETGSKIQPDEPAITTYYDENSERLRHPEQVEIREVSATTEKEGWDLRRQIETGTAILDLIQRSGATSHGDRRGRGQMRLFRQHGARYPELVDSAFAAALGELVGPVRTPYGYSVFRKLRASGGDRLTLEEARLRIESVLRKGREEELIDALIENLRRRNADQIEIFEELLE